MSPQDPPLAPTESLQSRSTRRRSPRARPSRRAVLATVGTALASATAGCNVLDGGGETEPLHESDWLAYGNGPTNDNRVPGGAPPPNDRETLASADWPFGPPVVHRGIAYFAADRRVVAVSLDGGPVWSKRLDIRVTGAPAVDPDRGRLYVPTRGVPTADAADPVPASVAAISITDGELVRSTRVGTGRTYGVTVADGDVYVRSASRCTRLSPDGTERWRRPLDPLVYEEYNLGDSTATQVAPAVTGAGVYVPDRNALTKLDPETGREQWRVSVDTPYAASVTDDRGVVQTGWRETIAVDHAGEVRWRRDLHSRAGAAAADGDVYVSAHDLHELDADTGETNWQAHLPNEGTAAPVVTDDSVVVATGDLRAFRRDTGGLPSTDRKRWETSSVHAAAYASPVIAAGCVFVTGPAGLSALRPERRRTSPG